MHSIWKEKLDFFLNSEKFKKIEKNVADAELNHKVFPPKEKRLAVFNDDPTNIRVVIIGQDPYVQEGQAHGYCFSVLPGITPPPSLINIYKEIEAEGLGVSNRKSGHLQKWVDQGVMLLNSHLTVNEGDMGSHIKLGVGWEEFTDLAIQKIQEIRVEKPLVFLLWGNHAKKKQSLIYKNVNTCVIATSHPAPLGFFKGFSGSGCFKKCNDFLVNHGEQPVDWVIQ